MSELISGAMTGADRLNHATAIAQSKRGRGMQGGIATAGHARPLMGLGAAAEEIIGASGLGRRAPEGPTPGEQMSDADEPTQDVQVDGDQAVHRKSVNGGVRETPLSAYDSTLAKQVFTAPWSNGAEDD